MPVKGQGSRKLTIFVVDPRRSKLLHGTLEGLMMLVTRLWHPFWEVSESEPDFVPGIKLVNVTKAKASTMEVGCSLDYGAPDILYSQWLYWCGTRGLWKIWYGSGFSIRQFWALCRWLCLLFLGVHGLAVGGVG